MEKIENQIEGHVENMFKGMESWIEGFERSVSGIEDVIQKPTRENSTESHVTMEEALEKLDSEVLTGFEKGFENFERSTSAPTKVPRVPGPEETLENLMSKFGKGIEGLEELVEGEPEPVGNITVEPEVIPGPQGRLAYMF